MTFTDELIQKVWEKGQTVAPYDPRSWRKDDCGAWMQRSKYGDRNSPFGWEISKLSPDEPDVVSNFRPLHWKNNEHIINGNLKCLVTARDTKAIDNDIPDRQ